MRLMYSGRDFAWVYEWADQVSFLDRHVRAFAAFDGVPQRCIYNNLSAAVRRLVLPERELTARFQSLASHYLFEPCFTRPVTGHDKSGVEGRGKGIRLQEFTPIPRGESLAAINAQLAERLATVAATRRREGGRTIQERFEAERAQLLRLPATAYEPRKVVPCSVSRRALVRVEGAVYSVPCARNRRSWAILACRLQGTYRAAGWNTLRSPSGSLRAFHPARNQPQTHRRGEETGEAGKNQEPEQGNELQVGQF